MVHSYYEKYPEHTSISMSELDTIFNANYLLQDSERQELTTVLENIYATEVNDQLITELLREHKRRCLAGELARVALDVEEGKKTPDELKNLFDDFELEDVVEINSTGCTDDLDELLQGQFEEIGLRWRLKFLNQSLGSLRQGDFGFIFARPETGKTTFIASEIANMINYTDKEIHWFHNEEGAKKVQTRVYQSVLNVTIPQLTKHKDKCKEKYKELTYKDNKKRIFIHDIEESSHYKTIENILKANNPGLIILDQIDKVKGFKADRNDLELKALYQWARETCKKYAPVIAVSQASGEAEGKLWLTMDMVDSSKTAKQGEADWILGIGKEQDNTSRIRYLNITKNKLLGDPDSLPALRHGQSQVIIRPEVARYEDI
jgi:replicative DNA helicase